MQVLKFCSVQLKILLLSTFEWLRRFYFAYALDFNKSEIFMIFMILDYFLLAFDIVFLSNNTLLGIALFICF